MQVKCKKCKKEFYAKPSQIKRGRGKFCSKQCYGIWQSESDIKRFDIAKWRKDHPEVEEKRLKAIRGKKLSEEHKRKLREANLKNGHTPPTNKGKKHPKWKGGKWGYANRKAKERDNYTCQVCGQKDKDLLCVHHIVPCKSNQKRRYMVTDINGLITLCVVCHRLVHKNRVKLPKTAHLKSSLNNGKP